MYVSPPTLHTSSINSVCWAPYELGLLLACGSSDGTISVLEHKADGSWEATKLPGNHPVGCTAVSWSPAVPAGALLASKPPGPPVKRLVSAGCDSTIKVRSPRCPRCRPSRYYSLPAARPCHHNAGATLLLSVFP